MSAKPDVKTEAKTLNLQEFLSNNKFSGFQIGLYFMLLIILLFNGVSIAMSGFAGPFLQAEWHLDPKALPAIYIWAMAAVQLGAVFGALIGGPVADRFGRKNVVIVSALIFSFFNIICGFVQDPGQMAVVRFITGLGIGGALANSVPLFSEFCPVKRRSFLTTLMYCGFPFGSALGGFFGAATITATGWRMFYWLMGIFPLVLVIIFAFFIPESVRFMIYKKAPADKIRAVLSKIAAVPAGVTEFISGEKEATSDEKKEGAGLVMSKYYLVGTLMLWITYFCGLVIVYSLQQWLPTLLPLASNGAIDKPTAMFIASLYNLGAPLAIVLGLIMDRKNPNIVVSVTYALTFVFVLMIGFTFNSNLLVLGAMVFLGGMFINVAQSAMPSLAAPFYPAKGRATGVSWMTGIGRVGGVLGIVLFGSLFNSMKSANISYFTMIAIVAVFGLICSAALLVKNGVYKNKKE